MQLDLYNYRVDPSHLDYEFFSQGPKGKIKKVVRFTLMESSSVQFYNLGFGDWNEEKEAIDDFAITNNADMEKVLATVAAIVIDFTSRLDNVLIYAEGSTSSRTRLYQMGINKLWDEIQTIFDVYGVHGDKIAPFRKSVNYDAFWVRKK